MQSQPIAPCEPDALRALAQPQLQDLIPLQPDLIAARLLRLPEVGHGHKRIRQSRMELHWGRLIRCYSDRPATVDVMFRGAVVKDPESEAIVDGAVRLSYRDLNRRVDQLAGGLTARGIHAGDRVAVILANRLEAIVSVLAIAHWCSRRAHRHPAAASGNRVHRRRKKDMINRGGFKVYPAEVENVLSEYRHVVEAAVVGRPDDILGERVVAYINATDPAITEQAIQEFCASRLADYKVPDRVVIGKEPLPRNANGKIQKGELRRLAEALERPRR